MSKASDIATLLSNRIETITTANDFSTNIGAQVFRGRLTIDRTDLPCAVIVEGEDQVEDGKLNAKVKLAQRYIIEGHDVCDAENPNDKAHLILADLKKAIFGDERNLGGVLHELRYVGRNIGPRPDGADIVAASVEIECVFVEDLTSP